LTGDVSDCLTLHVDTEFYRQGGRNYWHMVPATADTQSGDFSNIPWDLNTAGDPIAPAVSRAARVAT
jgi:hypothetical protein